MGKQRPLQQLQQAPTYCLHRPTGQSYATAPATATTNRRPVYFGLWGTEASLKAYGAFLEALGLDRETVRGAVREAQKRSQRPQTASAPLPVNTAHCTVRQLWSEFNRWAKDYYRSAAGEPTGEADNFAVAVRELLDLFGSEFTADFSKKKLDRVRQALVDRQLSRKTVNSRVNKVKRVFRWGTEEDRQLVPDAVAATLYLLKPLQPNRTAAKEREPVRGVEPERVEKAATQCKPVVRAMVLLQLRTGMRPGEVRGLRKRMVQQVEDNWLIDFGTEHKNGYRKQSRVVPLGPRAAELVQQWLQQCKGEADYLFPHRKGKFDKDLYRLFLRRAAVRAGVRPFSPNQIRHTAAEQIRKSDGLEAVQAVLGHRSRASSERYAPPVSELAVEVAKRRG